MDVSGSLHQYRSVEDLARNIQAKVLLSTGVWTRVGVGPSKILAKTATDNFAKQNPDGIFKLDYDNIQNELWPLPVHKMYMVANRMTYHFNRMGLNTIGDVAWLGLYELKQKMRRGMGKQSDIKAVYYWKLPVASTPV